MLTDDLNKYSCDGLDVREFIQQNYTPYTGDDTFLCKPTQRTTDLLESVNKLLCEEQQKNGVLDIDTKTVSGITAYEAAYITKTIPEKIVGLQSDAPLKRTVNPFGGIRMAKQACEAYGYKLSEEIKHAFKYHQTHNDCVFSMYSDVTKKLRHAGILTGLPDAYGRGRIIGDYRRVALFGVDALIQYKKSDKYRLSQLACTAENLQLLDELSKQITALQQLKELASSYGIDIRMPAQTAQEAIQWTYFGYLAAIKEQNGAAMSLGRVDAFFDIFIENDIRNGILTEETAQELIDDFVIKLRLVRQLRTPEYNDLFGGDPTWVTASLGGTGLDGRTLVTKTTYRLLHTLYNLGPAPEPNLTVLWSNTLPENFKHYCAKVSVDTNAVQYENDDLMRYEFSDDYGIACCVSGMKLGRDMQYFGARCNLAKVLLLAINGGRDELTGEQIAPVLTPAYVSGEPLNYERVYENFNFYLQWVAQQYINTLNIIHYSHDKHAYEAIQMALHDTYIDNRYLACGVAGLSVVSDSLSAIKHSTVVPVTKQTEYGEVVTAYNVPQTYPMFGNDLDEVDDLAIKVLQDFKHALNLCCPYRDAKITLSVLTITSNVVYGKKTGATPDGRKAGQPFAPGANPMHNREHNGALASLNSVAKLPYNVCKDGISNTFTIVPMSLGHTREEQYSNLVTILNGYFIQGGHHLNVNVLTREALLAAYHDPSAYPNLTIRVSGYAVNFHKLNKEQQREVLQRTFHEDVQNL